MSESLCGRLKRYRGSADRIGDLLDQSAREIHELNLKLKMTQKWSKHYRAERDAIQRQLNVAIRELERIKGAK